MASAHPTSPESMDSEKSSVSSNSEPVMGRQQTKTGQRGSIRDIREIIVGRISKLQTVAFSCVLEDCIDQLQILGSIGALPNVKPDIEYKTVEQQYGGTEKHSYIFDPETLESYAASTNTQMLLKFQEDRSYVEQVLTEANEEIVTKMRISKFLDRLDEFRRAEVERCQLMSDAEENVETSKTLSHMLVHERQRLTHEIQEKSEEVARIKDQYEDLTYENDMKIEYLGTWEKARNHQNEVCTANKEKALNDTIGRMKEKRQREGRIHFEIECFENQTLNSLRTDIATWMEKHDRELEDKEIDIQILKRTINSQATTYLDLKELYENHKQELEDYLAVKEQRRKDEEELQRQSIAATKIQAWWRGVMYRKGLGRYRKRRRRKGSAKGGKGGKGKKK